MFCCFSGCIQGKRWCQQDNKEAGSPPSHCEEHIRPSFLMLQFPSSMFSKNGLTSGRGSFHPGAHLTSPFAQTMRKYNCYLKAKRVRPKQLKHVMEWLSNKDMYCYSFCYIFIYTGWSLAHKDKHTKYQGITQTGWLLWKEADFLPLQRLLVDEGRLQRLQRKSPFYIICIIKYNLCQLFNMILNITNIPKTDNIS